MAYFRLTPVSSLKAPTSIWRLLSFRRRIAVRSSSSAARGCEASLGQDSGGDAPVVGLALRFDLKAPPYGSAGLRAGPGQRPRQDQKPKRKEGHLKSGKKGDISK